ncbi:zinc-binding dehydrogenase [Amycolatopsis endophytica]|uniref:NADPH2:quinone reductase n=1 Tax=Amycolatopsis endophytica TaxID=860233 RepID=A0A853AX25_9PSEU|nr:zinc-binding dehydrogenase [Amycolatopsis endophytica]NYI87293.1 NADPH2:quinone reductase [Amycolatopsis endophytica]
MKAIQMTETGTADVLKHVELTDPVPAAGEVLIRVESAAVNFADVARRRGDRYPDPTPLPFTPGAEVAGTVAAVGDDVTGVGVGTPVFGSVGPYANGGYAEFSLARQSNVIPLPPGVDPDLAAGLLAVGLTATLILTETANLAEGQSVFIPAAAGGVGSYAVQIAKTLGASTIIAGASTPEKREIALRHGAHHAIDYRQENWPAQVRELTDGKGVDVGLDMMGPKHLPATLSALAPFGRLVTYGAITGLDGQHLDGDALTPLIYDPAPGQSLTGFNLGAWFALRPERAIGGLGRLLGWISEGKVTGPTIHPMPLAEAAEAHRLLESGSATGKLILKP